MKRNASVIGIIIGAIVGFVIFGMIGNHILYPHFIPDDCYYHNHDTGFLIEALFDFPSANGYHPVPTKLGYLLLGATGAYIGYRISMKINTLKRNK
jgi:uncharacterized membrane protein YfcA